MLLWMLHRIVDVTGVDSLASVTKITFRAALAAGVAFALALLLGPRMIAWLRRRFREPNRSDSPRLEELHASKHATPTMGGLFLVAGVLAALVLLADPVNPFVQVAVLLTAGLAAVGVVDDLIKLHGDSRGLSARAKLLGQLAVASVAAVWLFGIHSAEVAPGESLTLWIPLADASLPIGWGFVPLAILVIVGTSNAVNLTDGLDGLAGGCLVLAIGAMAAIAYSAGHAEIARYLGIAGITNAGEMTVLAAAMIGGLLGFLWFNCHPARVFMGDTGSLPLGGLLGLIALAARQEILLLLVGGVFVAEAVSVMVQVVAYRWRRRRVFLCAPLHHHFQFKGLPEGQIVVRFWIAAAVCAIVGIACLKVQIHENGEPEAALPHVAGRLPVSDVANGLPRLGATDGVATMGGMDGLPVLADRDLPQYPVTRCEYVNEADLVPFVLREAPGGPLPHGRGSVLDGGLGAAMGVGRESSRENGWGWSSTDRLVR